MIPYALILIPVAFVLGLVLLVIWTRQDGERPVWLAVGAMCSAAFAFFWFPDFGGFGRDLVILQAGLSALNIDHLFGNGNHFCTTCMQASEVLSRFDGPMLPIEYMVLFNRILHVLNAGFLVMVGLEVTGSLIWPPFFVAGFVGIPIVAVAARTNYPSAFLLTLFFIGLLSGAVFVSRRSGLAAQIIAIAGLLVVTALAFLTRPDMATPGLAAIAVIIGSDRAVRPILARGVRVVRTLLRLPEPGRPPATGWTAIRERNWFVASLLAVLLMIALEVASNMLDERSVPVWLIDGVNLMNPSTANMFFHTFLLLPFSMALLAVVGFARQIRHPVLFLGLPVSMIFLMKTYSSASRYDYHTLFRMFSVILPMILVVACWGLRDLNRAIGRYVPDVRLRLLVAALVIASFSINTPFVRKAMRVHRPPEGYLAAFEEPEGLLGMNPQLEVRFLVDALRDHPECVLHTKVIGTDGYEDVAAGRSEGRFKDVWITRRGVSDRPSTDTPSCQFFYRSLDCNLLGRHACDQDVSHGEPVSEISFSSRPYGDYLLVRYDQPVVLGLYRVGR